MPLYSFFGSYAQKEEDDAHRRAQEHRALLRHWRTERDVWQAELQYWTRIVSLGSEEPAHPLRPPRAVPRSGNTTTWVMLHPSACDGVKRQYLKLVRGAHCAYTRLQRSLGYLHAFRTLDDVRLGTTSLPVLSSLDVYLRGTGWV